MSEQSAFTRCRDSRDNVSVKILDSLKGKGLLYRYLQYIKSESKAAFTAAGWMREGLVEMRNLSSYQSVLAAILNKGWRLYVSDGGAGAERQGDKDENEFSGM